MSARPDLHASRRAALIGALAVQILIVPLAVWPQLSARLVGQEVRLAVRPVDPIDPLRGAYLALGYPGLPGSLPSAAVETPSRGVVFVPLTRASGALWTGGTPQPERPSSGPYLRCQARGRLDCGIDSWFLPQGTASSLGRALANGQAIAVVRVDGRGNAALVGLEVADS